VNRNEKAAFLMDEIGNVDETYLEQALSYSETKEKAGRIRKGFRLPPAAVISVSAACLTLVFAVLLGLLFVRLPIFRPASSVPEDAASGTTAAETGDRLSSVLTSASSVPTTDEMTPKDFFGQPLLVWQTEEGGNYSVLRLSVSQAEVLKTLMAKSERNPVRVDPEETETGRCSVWLLSGDGTAVTPYLPSSEGNKSCASLFNYDPEILPDPALADYVSRLTGNA